MSTVFDSISHLGPCPEACAWARRYKDPVQAWAECTRGDWMLWLLGKHAREPESNARKALVLCCCECARLALPHTKDQRVLACIETAERWAKGEATREELREARKAAAAAAYDAANAAAYAAYAAYDAANAAAYYAAAAAADAANAAAYYASHAAANASREKILSQCADIVRKHYPQPPQGDKMKQAHCSLPIGPPPNSGLCIETPVTYVLPTPEEAEENCRKVMGFIDSIRPPIISIKDCDFCGGECKLKNA